MKRFFRSVLFAAIAAAITMPWSLGRTQVINSQLVVMAAAAQTAAQVNSADITNKYYHGTHLVITISGYVSGSYTLTLQGKNLTTGSYYDLLVGPAMAANGQTVLKLYPGITGSANGAANDFLPQTWRVQLNGTGSPNMTVVVDAMMAGG